MKTLHGSAGRFGGASAGGGWSNSQPPRGNALVLSSCVWPLVVEVPVPWETLWRDGDKLVGSINIVAMPEVPMGREPQIFGKYDFTLLSLSEQLLD